jgi:hypothetical protein
MNLDEQSRAGQAKILIPLSQPTGADLPGHARLKGSHEHRTGLVLTVIELEPASTARATKRRLSTSSSPPDRRKTSQFPA